MDTDTLRKWRVWFDRACLTTMSHPGHRGRPGQQGGSLPASAGSTTDVLSEPGKAVAAQVSDLVSGWIAKNAKRYKTAKDFREKAISQAAGHIARAVYANTITFAEGYAVRDKVVAEIDRLMT